MSEILPGFHVVKGKYVEGLGLITSYVVVDSGEAVVIDPGTDGDPGTATVDTLRALGISPKQDVVGILCTHGHPDHVGGTMRLKRVINAPVLIHSGDAELLEVPATFIDKRLLLDSATRFAMRFDRSPLRVNYTGMRPDRILRDGDEIKVGGLCITTIHTGGHSAGHCVFYEKTQGVLFSGDEVINIANAPHQFYVDLSGSLSAKLTALESLYQLRLQCLLPSHDVPALFDKAYQQFELVRNSVIQFMDSVLGLIAARKEADVSQIQYDLSNSIGSIVPKVIEFMMPSTLVVVLRCLQNAGLVIDIGDGTWRIVDHAD